MDIASRAFLGALGIGWFALCSLNIELGQREGSFSYREWLYVAQGVCGLFLFALSCLPRRTLSARPIKWGLVIASGFVAYGIAMIAYKNAHILAGLYESLRAGSEIQPDSAPTRMVQFGVVAAVAIATDIALVLSVVRLALRSGRNQ